MNLLVADNLKTILNGRTPEAYCKENGGLFYVTGRKMGRKVSARALRYAITDEQSPRLDLIAAIAAKEDLQPYQILFHEFDPKNAPVMISRAQQELIASLQEAARAIPETVKVRR